MWGKQERYASARVMQLLVEFYDARFAWFRLALMPACRANEPIASLDLASVFDSAVRHRARQRRAGPDHLHRACRRQRIRQTSTALHFVYLVSRAFQASVVQTRHGLRSRIPNDYQVRTDDGGLKNLHATSSQDRRSTVASKPFPPTVNASASRTIAGLAWRTRGVPSAVGTRLAWRALADSLRRSGHKAAKAASNVASLMLFPTISAASASRSFATARSDRCYPYTLES